MQKEFNAERERLLANNISVKLELKTVTEDLTDQLTVAKSQAVSYTHLTLPTNREV